METFSRLHGVNLYVKFLDDSIDDARLYNEFCPFGKVISAKVMMWKDVSKGFGFVCFALARDALNAMRAMHGRTVGSKALYVALAQCKEQRRAYLNSLTHDGYLKGLEDTFISTQYFYSSAYMAQESQDEMSSSETGQSLEPAVQKEEAVFTGIPNQPIRKFSKISILRRITKQPPPCMQGNISIPQDPITNEYSASDFKNTSNIKDSPAHFDSEYAARAQQAKKSFVTKMLASLSPLEQREMLGEMLFPRIQHMCGSMANKITVMLLELNSKLLFYMMEHNDYLKSQVDEALSVLRDFKEKAHGNGKMEEREKQQEKVEEEKTEKQLDKVKKEKTEKQQKKVEEEKTEKQQEKEKK